MGLFDNLFGKKKYPLDTKETETDHLNAGDAVISPGDNSLFKVIRRLTSQQKELINKSTIPLRTGQLYTHYWTDNLVCEDRTDQEWQKKVMFFWKAEEPFPKKSLPPIFESFQTKYFLFTGDTSKISLQTAQALPWFGMPGLGEKHLCKIDGQNVTIPELYQLGLVDYIQPVELSDNNLEILTDKDNYMFLVDERITPFYEGNFHLHNKRIRIEEAYSIGGIHIVKKTKLD